MFESRKFERKPLRECEQGREPRPVDATHVADARLSPHHAGRRAEHRGLLRDPSGTYSPEKEVKFRGKESVLRVNVGPANSRNVSEICLKTVRKLSVTKNCQKTV